MKNKSEIDGNNSKVETENHYLMFLKTLLVVHTRLWNVVCTFVVEIDIFEQVFNIFW